VDAAGNFIIAPEAQNDVKYQHGDLVPGRTPFKRALKSSLKLAEKYHTGDYRGVARAGGEINRLNEDESLGLNLIINNKSGYSLDRVSLPAAAEYYLTHQDQRTSAWKKDFKKQVVKLPQLVEPMLQVVACKLTERFSPAKIQRIGNDKSPVGVYRGQCGGTVADGVADLSMMVFDAETKALAEEAERLEKEAALKEAARLEAERLKKLVGTKPLI